MFNKTNRSWAESENGRILSTFGVQVLNPHKNVVDNNLVDFDWKVGTPPFSIHADNNRHVISTIRGHCLVDGQPSSITRSNDEQQGTTLLDSGALDANYITSSYLQILCDNKCNLKFRHANEHVTAAFGSSALSKKRVVMNFTLTHGRTKYNLHNEEFKVLDRMPFDVIIGLPCIRRHDLTRVFRVHFVDNQEPVAGLKGTVRAVTTNTSSNPTAGDSWLFAMGSKTVHKSILLDTEYDDDAIEQFTHEAPWDNPPLNLEADVSYLIYGDLELREKLHALCHQNRDIFSKAVGPTPASLPPFQMEVDKTQWERSMNRTPLRPQTAAKIMAAQKFIRQALADGVIVPSQAPYWSQVLLTPKKDGNFRFCLDYRNLNKCTKSMGWPLPNIASTLQRIGSHKPKYFAVLDLTSGYHQCPISIDSQDYTSFLTSEGLFKWTRLPMGPKGAPSYFQQHMCTTILAGLIHIILEVYLDDIIVFASTEGEYLQRIQTVFDRLRKFNITLNPDKCRFGLNKVEYVGHTIDETGLHFSQEKLDKVLNFPQPVTHRQMKTFLGLASYFRDHVHNHSALVHELQKMITPYCKTRKLIWSEVTTHAFTQARNTIAMCPKLFFINENAPIVLCTDASDYGIGAYLYQVVDEQEQPISFLSKTLDKTQMKWSTIEKEAYAIYYAFHKFDYLIRDSHFLLKTDHANLTYINTNSKQKVQRWKLAIQEYDFDIEHIKGENNIAADAFSRLCTPTEPLENDVETLFTIECSDSIRVLQKNKQSTQFNCWSLWLGKNNTTTS